jgi:hypothetical protein
MKEARKQAKQRGKKPNNKDKNPNGGKEEKNKKKGFHEMATKFIASVKFTWPHWMVIKVDSVATKFNRHCWMANKMGLVTTIG